MAPDPNAPRSILITGCSSGIGLASAKMMKARGWQVLATARTRDDLEFLQDGLGVEAIHLELSDPDSVIACGAAALTATNGVLFALFNNAAFGQVGAVEDISPQLLRRQFEINVIGGHALTRMVLPAMRRNNAGRIVQCSSVLGLVAGPYRGAYCASKFALEALTDSMRLEFRKTNIHFSLIEPGPIRTKFVASALEAFKRDIDLESSVHREAYEVRLKQMEAGGRETFKLEPEAVVKKLVHAVESRRPKPRYFVTKPTYFADVARRVLPTRWLDRVLMSG